LLSDVNSHSRLSSQWVQPSVSVSYCCDLAEHLKACHAIAKVLVQEWRCWHHLLLTLRPDQTLAFVSTLLATSSLLDVPLGLILSVGRTTSACIHLQRSVA